MALPYPIDDYGLDEFVAVAAHYGQKQFGFVVTPNVDHLIRFHDDPGFRHSYGEAAFVLLDSRILAHVFRVTKGVRPKICTGSDLTWHLFQDVIEPSDSIVLIGGNSEQVRTLTERYGLRNLRHYDPPMGFWQIESATEACLQFIETNSPFRFCFLAVGSPQQEMLARRLKERGVARGLGLCVGASINFLTGIERRAPKWMQRIAAEWLFRLLSNPLRLARRYLIRGPRLFLLLYQTDVGVRARAPAETLVLVNGVNVASGQSTQTPESI
jgi:exopolysaccharide biosynthesis WecB/TagA/CpsF family protein